MMGVFLLALGLGLGFGLVYVAASGLGRPVQVVVEDNRTLVLVDRRTVVMIAGAEAPGMATDPPVRDDGEMPMIARGARLAVRSYRATERVIPTPRRKELTC